MATPITIRQRDEAVEKNKKKKEQQQFQRFQRQRQHQPSVSYTNPNCYQLQPIPIFRAQPVDFTKDAPYDWDDWTNQGTVSSPPTQKQNIYKDFTVQKDDIFLFHGKEHYMSTFYEAPFNLTNHRYPNVETYYEACKLYCLVDSTYAPILQKAKYAAEAKKIASKVLRQYNVPRKVINQFKRKEGAHAVYNATYAKFNDNPELKRKLLETGNKLIVHCYDKDDIFACGCSETELNTWLEKNDGKNIKIPMGRDNDLKNVIKIGKGLNLLGFFCMSIREQFRAEEANMAAMQSLSLL